MDRLSSVVLAEPYLQRDTLRMTNGNHPVTLERTGDPRGGYGWDNPHGATVLALNGLFEQAKDWRYFGRKLSDEAGAEGLDLTVLTVNDPLYYNQADYTETGVAVAKNLHKHLAPGHKLWLAGHSRGGVTAAMSAKELNGYDVVDGVHTMATPVCSAELSMGSMFGWYREMAEISHWVADPEVAPQLASLYVSIGQRATRRALLHLGGLRQEISSIMAAASPDEMVFLSRETGINVSAALYEHDGVILEKLQKRRLEIAKFAGPVLSLQGSHVTPLVDKASREALLNRIAPYELQAIA